MLLRLEFLFDQLAHASAGDSVWDTRAALHSLFEILDLLGRNELRAELLKELDRHTATLNRLRPTPGVNPHALGVVLDEINAVVERLYGLNSQRFEEVRQNDFLNAIRQRSNIPGGTCRFDLPALHNWLQQGPEQRNPCLDGWLAPFQPMEDAVRLILRLIRTSADCSDEIARSGFFQKSLDSTAPSQIVRVLLPREARSYPEISGGRHRFSIRFMYQPDPSRRAQPLTEDVAFRLMCCVI